MDQVKTVTKWIKKIKTRANQENNKTFPSSSTKCRRTSRSKVFRAHRSKNLLRDFESELNTIRVQDKTTDTDVEGRRTLKQVIKSFLSPNKNRSSENKNKNIKQLDEDSKSSQAPELKQIASVSMSSLLIVGNFRTSSPVFNRKTFDAGAQAQDDGDDDNSSTESPTTSTDLIRSNSDSEILPLVDSRNSDEEIGEFTRTDILRHSYPGSCNSTRRDSCQRMMRCVLENMATNMIDDHYNHSTSLENDTLNSEIQKCFESFDESITPDDSFGPKKTMRETLLEISSRRKSMINKEKIFCPMKSPTKKNNGDCWKLKLSSDMSNVTSPKGLGIHTMNISEEKEDQSDGEIEKEITKNYSSVSNDENDFDSPPRRRTCFEDSYIYNSNNSLVISTYV